MRSMSNTNFSCKAGRGGWRRGLRVGGRSLESKTSQLGLNPTTLSPSRKVDPCFGRNLLTSGIPSAQRSLSNSLFRLAIRNQAIFGVAIGQWPTQRWPLDRLSSFLRNLHLPNPSRQPDTLRPVTRVLGLPQQRMFLGQAIYVLGSLQ